MAYVDLSSIELKTDFTAKDITIINYNATLEEIRVYLEQLAGNITHVQENAMTNIPVTYDDEPENYDGNIYFKLED